MIRKSLFTIFFLFLCSLISWGQNIRVESFNRLDNDITARTSVVLDANDDECALIKMVTTDTDYNVDGYIKRRDDRVGELWFYVPQGTKQIVIRHKRLGKLVYPLPEVLKSKVTYQITLPDNVEIIVHEDAGGQYLVMKVEPAESTVYIDGIAETLNGGVLQKFLSYGAHTYRVEAPLYQPIAGNIQIADARKDMAVSLLPDYGFVKFTSVPENGATVYMNGQELGKTPFTTGRLMKGTYTVNATLPMHAPATRQIMIEPGKTSNVTLNFSASYGTVNLTAAGADIYVNNELKGAGKWSGRLSAGLHRIEARKAGHRPGVLSLDVVAGQTQTVSLPAPAPMYASLDISCNQTDAHVYIDGKDMGVAPNIFKVLSGKHTVELKNETFKSQKYEVELAEGEAKRVEGTLTERVKIWTINDVIPPRGKKISGQILMDRNNAICYTAFGTDFYKYSFENKSWKLLREKCIMYPMHMIKKWGVLIVDREWNSRKKTTNKILYDLKTCKFYEGTYPVHVNFVNEDFAIWVGKYDFLSSDPISVYYKDGRSYDITVNQPEKNYLTQKDVCITGKLAYIKTYDYGITKKTKKKGLQNIAYYLCSESGVKRISEEELPADVNFVHFGTYKLQNLTENVPNDITPYTTYNPALADFISEEGKEIFFAAKLKRLGKITKPCLIGDKKGEVTLRISDDGDDLEVHIRIGKKVFKAHVDSKCYSLIHAPTYISSTLKNFPHNHDVGINIDHSFNGSFKEAYSSDWQKITPL